MTAAKQSGRRRPRLEPLTVDHFRGWALEQRLDNGDAWRVEEFFLWFVADYFDGLAENWLLVPEANTKTTSLGGLGVYLLEFRREAMIPWAASARDQAEIGYRQAAGFIRRSPRLSSLMRCYDGYRRIVNEETGGRIQVFAADAGTGDGVIFTDAFLDELHRHRSLDLYRTWTGKTDKRSGQVATISTAGEPGSEFEETRTAIRDAVPAVDRRPGFTRYRGDGICLHEWAVPEGGDVEDMRVVKQANPFSGITVESLAEKRGRPTMTEPHWRRFVCNLATRSEASAVGDAEWQEARVNDRIPAGEPVWLGVDVAWKWDTTALVPLWWRDHEFRLFGDAVILEPPRDGTSLDPHRVEEALLAVHDRNPVHTVVMDTTKAEQLAEWMRETLGCEVVDRAQTNSFAVMDYERFMEALRNGWLHHTGDPGLARHVLNAVARQLPRGDIRFDRPARSRNASGQDRRVIDALTAAAMVHTSAAGPPQDPEPMVAVI